MAWVPKWRSLGVSGKALTDACLPVVVRRLLRVFLFFARFCAQLFVTHSNLTSMRAELKFKADTTVLTLKVRCGGCVCVWVWVCLCVLCVCRFGVVLLPLSVALSVVISVSLRCMSAPFCNSLFYFS